MIEVDFWTPVGTLLLLRTGSNTQLLLATTADRNITLCLISATERQTTDMRIPQLMCHA
jgi:hypothetical protein